MNLFWLSANVWGYELLKETLSLKDPEIEISRILTLYPDSKTRMYDNINKEKWSEFKIPITYIKRIDQDGKEIIKELMPDLVTMIGWRQIVPKEVLDLPKYGFINTHPTLLPYGRGPAPIINQLLEGKKESGVTLIHTSEKTDAGDIIGQERFIIDSEDHASDLYSKIIESGKKLIRRELPKVVRNNSKRTTQDESTATTFNSPININLIKPTDDIETVYKKIKAVSRPYNGAYLEDPEGNKVIIWRARETKFPIGVSYNHKLNLENLLLEENVFFSDGIRHLQIIEKELIRNDKQR